MSPRSTDAQPFGPVAGLGQAGHSDRAYTEADFQDFGHTGPGTLAGRFMRMFWQPVYLSAQLPPGRAVPIRIMSEDLTLYRGDDGGAHLLSFRCAHRGAQLSVGWVEGSNLRCFYHGWVYDASGQCVEQPAEPEPFCQRVKIRSYPAQEYQGLIFAYLGEGDPPELPRFPELEGDGELRVRTYTWACNYFQSVENNLDASHVAFTHRHPRLIDGKAAYPAIWGEETDYGIRRMVRYPDGFERVGHFHMPNVAHLYRASSLPGSWMDIVVTRVPVDDDRFVSFGRVFLHITGMPPELARASYSSGASAPRISVAEIGDAVLRGEIDIHAIADSIGDATRQLELEDYVTQVGQGPIAAREGDHLGRADAEIMLLRSIWTRELRALAEGTPLKRRRRSAEALRATAE
jgi:5,5'-dehydrodivanillate O-demethylase